MKRPLSHQIDDAAQLVLQKLLPLTWVVNPHQRDYAKDYLVEIGDDDGTLTGSSFFVQLKGQKAVKTIEQTQTVSFNLEAKYAAYYAQKVDDLPVFLIVVDVSREKAWWLFLQPILQINQKWRDQKSITLPLPFQNELGNSNRFREAVVLAKQWMRMTHSNSIEDAVSAQKLKLQLRDSRFDISVSLQDESPVFNLHAREIVKLQLSIKGKSKTLPKRIDDLFERGFSVAFEPGEVQIAGSNIFADVGKSPCTLQASKTIPGAVSLVCCDKNGIERARLANIRGQFRGGRSEFMFEGEYPNTPIAIVCGPFAKDADGSLNLSFDLERWNDYPLKQLPYFERLSVFFEAIRESISVRIDVEINGVDIEHASIPKQSLVQLENVNACLRLIQKARELATHFSKNFVWSKESFDRDTIENINVLYGVFIEGRYEEPCPEAQIRVKAARDTFPFVIIDPDADPTDFRVSRICTYSLFNEEVDVGRINFDYSRMKGREETPGNTTSALNNSRKAKGKKSKHSTPLIRVVLSGTAESQLRISPDTSCPDAGACLTQGGTG